MKVTVFLCFVMVSLVCCNEDSHPEAELLQLITKEKELFCELQSIRKNISNEWDHINNLLEEHLPEDIPIEEKANMLKARNANLIRMFESFDQVSEEVKQALKKTEMEDQAMSKRILKIKKTKADLETQKRAFIEQLSPSNKEQVLTTYKSLYEEALNQKCN